MDKINFRVQVLNKATLEVAMERIVATSDKSTFNLNDIAFALSQLFGLAFFVRIECYVD